VSASAAAAAASAVAAAAADPEPPVNLFCSLSCRNFDCTKIHFPEEVCPRYKGGNACRHWYGEHKQVKDQQIRTTFGCNFASPAQVDFLRTHDMTLLDADVENALELACPEIVLKDGSVFIHGLTPAGAEFYRARLPACVRGKIYPKDVVPRIVAAPAVASTSVPPPRKLRNPPTPAVGGSSAPPRAASAAVALQQELPPWQQTEYLLRPVRSENPPRTPTSTLAAAAVSPAGGGSTAVPPPHKLRSAPSPTASLPPPRKLRNPPPPAVGGGAGKPQHSKPPHSKHGAN
jgi:hypothetical protein